MEYCQIHLLLYCLWQLSCYNHRAEQLLATETIYPTKSKILSGSLQKKFVDSSRVEVAECIPWAHSISVTREFVIRNSGPILHMPNQKLWKERRWVWEVDSVFCVLIRFPTDSEVLQLENHYQLERACFKNAISKIHVKR